MKFLLVFITFLFTQNDCVAQLNADSLMNVILKMPNDTASIYKIIAIGKTAEMVDFELALNIYRLAEKKYGVHEDDVVQAEIYANIAHGYSWQDNASEAIKYFLKTKDLGERLKNNGFIATGYSGIALVYHLNKDFKTAIQNYEMALRYYTDDYAQSKKYKVANLGNMGYAYYQQSQIIDTCLAGNTLAYKAMLHKAIFYNRLSLNIANKNKTDSIGMVKATINLCLEYVALGKIDSAIYYFDLSGLLLLGVKDLDAHCEHYYNKGQISFFKKDYKTALIAYSNSLSLAQQMKYQEYIYENYYSIYLCNQQLGNFNEALLYFKKFSIHKDSLLNRSKIIEGTDLKNKYLTQIKENEIIKLNTANKQKSTFNSFLIVAAIGLILFSLLGYRNFKNKQKVFSQQQQIQQQKIAELEKDKQLQAVDAMLRGQEEERSRIAKDLHDGLGGMLSGTKLSFENMKENLILTPDNAVLFDKSLNMLDNTIADLRKVAHNLMPEALVKFGLQEAVRDFCNSIQSATAIKIIFQPIGVYQQLNNTAEVFTYRIIQELVNNAVKHAKALQIIVQLTVNNNKISIAVEDDGKGFDVNALTNSKGAGMDNIKYRVQYFNGTIDTVTSLGNGTSVNVELRVEA